MRVLPVITRELRAQARQAFTYSMRMLGVMALLVTMLVLMFGDDFGAGNGSGLFVKLHRVVLLSIWILVPLSAADCISRERREGTLGLLFLTQLRPGDIVVAKTIAHVLRALTLWFVSLPVQMLPVLNGGVAWEHVLFSCVVNFWSISFVVSVSVVASASCQRASRAMALTAALGGVLAMILAYVFAVVIAFSFFLLLNQFASAAILGFGQDWNWFGAFVEIAKEPLMCVKGFFACIMGDENTWQGLSQMPSAAAKNCFLAAFGVGALFAFGVSSLLLWIAVKIISRHWQDSIRSARVEKLEQVFLKPVLWVSFLKRRMKRKLERNPIGWLEQRSWSGRIVSWVWFTIVIVVYSMMLTGRNFMYGLSDTQPLMAWLLAVSIAATTAASFRRERENGVLELLLVSPLKSREIIKGRLRGLWGQFFPACATLLFIWAYLINIFGRNFSYGGMIQVWFFGVTFLTIPAVGLYYSIRCQHFISAFLMTLGVGVAAPMIVIGIVSYNRGTDDWSQSIYSGSFLVQAVIAPCLLYRLQRRLDERSFPLERAI